MAETTAVRPARANRAAALIGLLLVGVAVVALIELTSASGRSPQWGGALFAVLTACLATAVMAIARSWRDRPTLAALLGLVLIALGSGIGRPRDQLWTGEVGSPTGAGQVIDRLDTWWVLIGAGMAVTVGALAWALRTSDRRSAQVLASGALLGVGAGYLLVTLVMRDVITRVWISGRPLRGRRREAGAGRWPVGHLSAGDLWRGAAADEAEAVAAFASLAERLTGVGAPGSLIDRCREAALEERRHVSACMQLASDLGLCASPRPSVPGIGGRSGTGGGDHRASRTTEVLRLATESFVDGVVGEGFAARRLEAGSTTVASGRGALMRSMAREERRHAALGADIVEWALRQHPLLVRGALRCAARRLPAEVEAPAPHRALRPDELRRAGMVDAHEAVELWCQQRTAALRWLEDVLASPVPDPITRGGAAAA